MPAKKFTEEDIKLITDKTNKRIHKEFPMLQNPIWEYMVREIIQTIKEGKWKL